MSDNNYSEILSQKTTLETIDTYIPTTQGIMKAN